MGELTKFMNEIAIKYSDYWYENEVANPKMSIIVAAYNVEDYIEKCLASLLKQTLKEIEVIVVNDGSNDLTPEIANVFQHCDKRFKLITQDNQKQGAARNNGLKVANGEYVGYVDADDYIDEDYFEKLYNTAKKYDSDIAVASVLKHKKTHSKYNVLYTNEIVANSLDERIKACEDKTRRFFNAWNKIYRSSLIKDNNILFAEGRIYEDVIFAIKALYYANKVVTVPNTEYHYVGHSNSTVKSKDTNGQKKKDHITAYVELIDFAKEHNIELPERLNYVESFWHGPLKVYKGTYKIKKMLFGIIPIYLKVIKGEVEFNGN